MGHRLNRLGNKTLRVILGHVRDEDLKWNLLTREIKLYKKDRRLGHECGLEKCERENSDNCCRNNIFILTKLLA